jgi:putative flippase GtrA
VKTFIRWGKFNLVGAMGMAVQLGTLALLERLIAGHYLYASAAALEITLLHNFVWHVHYTWRDRRDGSALLAQLTRFHLSNGLVSMVGNLALMRILVTARACHCSPRMVLRFCAARLSTSSSEIAGRFEIRQWPRGNDARTS